MKLMIQISMSFFTLLIFSQCKSSEKVLDKVQPFKIESATYSDWIGGVKGVRGTTIKIVVTNMNVNIDTLYFRGNKIIPELIKLENNKLQIVGNIINKEKQILVLHSNPKQEYGNKPPVKTDTNFPFELASDEIVISYIFTSTPLSDHKMIKYFKIKLTQEKTQLFQ